MADSRGSAAEATLMSWGPGKRPLAPCDAEPSYLYSNLSTTEQFAAYLSGDSLVVGDLTEPRGREAAPEVVDLEASGAAYQCRYCFLKNRTAPVLVVAGAFGLQVWEDHGGRLVASMGIEALTADGPTLLPGKVPCDYARGIGFHETENDLLIGMSTGKICIVEVSRTGSLRIRATLSQLEAPVSSCDTTERFLMAGAEDGAVAFWETGDRYLHLATFPQADDLVTCVRAKRASAPSDSAVGIAGYFTGKIRIFSISDNPSLFAEIDAHTRPVLALALDHASQTFASGSEDQVVSVWSIPCLGPKDDDMRHIYSDHLVSRMVTGLSFVPDGSGRLMSTAYGKPSLDVWEGR